MADGKAREYVFQKPARMTFVNLLEPKPFTDPRTKKPKGDPVYSATFLLDPAGIDWPAIKALCVEIAKENNADMKNNTNWPFKNGDQRADELAAQGKKGDIYRGKVILATATGQEYPPMLAVFKDGNPSKGAIDLTPATLAQYRGWFYNGSLASARVSLKWYEGVSGGKPGIKAYLGLVVGTNTGERIGGGKPASEVFKGSVGQVVNEDPTEGLDDEIPF